MYPAGLRYARGMRMACSAARGDGDPHLRVQRCAAEDEDDDGM